MNTTNPAHLPVSADQNDASPRRRTWKRRLSRWLTVVAVLLIAAGGWAYWRLRSSLPQLDGELVVPTLSSKVLIERDARGIPTISAMTREDAALALGVLHGQDRFFQMDLLRRVSSGRLSSLLGAAPVDFDTRMRLHRFGAMVEQAVAQLPDDQRGLLEAYAQGVNTGLASLGAPPPEYLLLRQTPDPWRVEDSLLVMLSMVHQLEPLDGLPKLAWTELSEKVPVEVFNFLVRKGSPRDAPLDESRFPDPAIPSAEVWSLRDSRAVPPVNRAAAAGRRADELSPLVSLCLRNPEWEVGSNAWAVAGVLTQSGSAILANDMHLGLRVPATWYQAAIICPMLDGQQRRLVGATLPGLPSMAVGSNGELAWGVTSARAIVGDLVELKPVEGSPSKYQTPDGPLEIERYSEEIEIAGGEPKTIEYYWSKWGPVVSERDDAGKQYAYRCVFHDPRTIDLNMLHLETASSVDAAMSIANQSGSPRLNCIAADVAGNVGWTLAGRMPKRLAPAQPTAVDWSVQDNNWSELLPAEEYPRIVQPESGRVWNANDRVLGQEYLDLMGYGDLAFGARSKQIRDRLFGQEKFDEEGLQAIQLDYEAIYMQYWQQLLLETATAEPGPLSDKCIAAVEDWGGKAAVDSVGYRVVSEFRDNVFKTIFGFHSLIGDQPVPAGSLADVLQLQAGWVAMNYDDAALDLLEARPMHWLPARFDNWEALLEEAARASEQRLVEGQPLEQATWGQANTTAIQHPLSRALPWLSTWLDMPPRPLPGDRNLPRVQGATFGASQRMVVTPGREEAGIYHQPGGVSGHFMSPFYRVGFDDWAEGHASSLLPGETVHRLTLTPSE